MMANIEITKEEAPFVLLAIVSCLDDSLYLEPEAEKALVAVYDKIQQTLRQGHVKGGGE